jgi:hypothetical protein
MNWYISDVPGAECCIRECCEDFEGNDPTVCDFPYGLDTPEEMARAKLIAAAPDLVEALREYDTAFTEANFDVQSDRMRMRKAIIKARAALAKTGSA